LFDTNLAIVQLYHGKKEQSKELAGQSKELAEQSKELAEQSKELAEQSKELAELKQEQSNPVPKSIRGKY
jgi:methyl-accepting chemotaxis protein